VSKSYLPKRYERKYVVSEDKARDIRQFIACHVEPDEYLTPDMPRGYPVYSLYLDSPRLSLYEATAQGMMNRFKLRIRYYNDVPDTPIFFEVKRRLNQIVRKLRVGVKRQSMMRILAGVLPCASDLYKPHARTHAQDMYALNEFCRLRAQLRALGTLIVGYHREAYLDPIGKSRVTFDRDLMAKQFDPQRGLVLDLDPVIPEDSGVIMELKYVDRLPLWMQSLIRQFRLERQSVPKYGWSVQSVGEPVVVTRTSRLLWNKVSQLTSWTP
jgi:hypothetical protein